MEKFTAAEQQDEEAQGRVPEAKIVQTERSDGYHKKRALKRAPSHYYISLINNSLEAYLTCICSVTSPSGCCSF